MQTDKPRELEAPAGEHPATVICESDEGRFELTRGWNSVRLLWTPKSRRSRMADRRTVILADVMRGFRRVLKGGDGRRAFDMIEQEDGRYFIAQLAPGTYYGNADNHSGTCRIGWLDEQDLVTELEGPAKHPQHDPDVVDAGPRHRRTLPPPRGRRRTLADVVQPPAQKKRRTLK